MQNYNDAYINELGEKLFLFTARPNSVQRSCFYCSNFQKNIYNNINDILLLPISRTDDEWFFSKKDFELLSEKQSEEFLGDDYLSKYIKKSEEYFKDWVNVCSDVAMTFGAGNNTNKFEIIRKYFDYPTRNNTYFYFALSVWSFEQKVVLEITKKLKEYYGNDFEGVWNIITSQTELTEEQQMRVALAELKESNNQSVDTNAFLDFERKYRYLGIYSPEDYGFDKNHFLELYNQIEIGNIRDMVDSVRKNRESFDELVNKTKETNIVNFIKLINYNVVFRTTRSEKISYGFSLATPLYDYLIEKTGYSRFEIGNVTSQEIIDYIESSVELPKRTRRPAVHFHYSKPIILDTATEEKFKKYFDLKKTNEKITGSIAFKGIAKGPVKVITSVDDLGKVNAGDVLVSQFTRPEYLSAMQKAVAFVTNDGGITCHAAIVARELKKPCIIGTKIATKVLKDGDMVEVDAEKGIVIKIS